MAEGHRKEWFDDDAFWEELFPFMFPEKKFSDAEEQAEALLALANAQGRRVLDLCCGPGRFTVALARRGFQVTGVDRTAFLLGKAKAGAKTAKVDVEFVQSDMRDFVRPGAFDLALSMFTSFGYFDDKGEDLIVLQHIHTSLAEGGRFVLDTMGKERLARVFQPTTSTELDDGMLLIQRHGIFDDWTRVRNEWILIRDGWTKSFTFHHTVYSGEELRALMLRAGFSEVKLYGDFDGSEYGINCTRLVAVAVK
jgi:SAM-dependent methyltransferase